MRRRLTARIGVLVAASWALLVLAAGCSLLEGRFEEVADVEAALRQEQEEGDIPSLCAAVVRDRAIEWEAYFGTADVERQYPAGPNAIYGVASVSKLVVATAAMQLVERGPLDLDADINNYLEFRVRNPAYPDSPITARHLMTHTSGLAWPLEEIPGFYDDWAWDSAPGLAEWLPEFIVPGGSSYLPVVWKSSAPGERELYSNIGVSLLGLVIERVSGQAFEEYCRDSIFLPLGMSSTSFSYRDLAQDSLARPYSPELEPFRFYRSRAYPAGALKTTVHDLARFLLAYINRGRLEGTRILSPESVDELLTLHNPTSGRCLLWTRTVGGWIGHTGGDKAFSAVVEYQPATGVGLVICTNRWHRSVYHGGRIHALVSRVATQDD
ncbi:MAG: beta-lactamase family protein [candidate division WOR-3 bacterium]|nr:MAG: beta-lactamase family protein [candidate division WOR-3 bacterium]